LTIEERVTLPDAPELRKNLPVTSREKIDELVPLLYQELREIAHRHLAARHTGATLNTTALINEAYLKLVDQSHADWNDRAHFLGVAALAMRHILVDRAKARKSGKRGGGQFRVTLDDNVVGAQNAPDALLQITDSLDRLALIDARLSCIVEYRFFGGLTNAEIATVLGITERTVERDWIKARMLLRELLAA
jgi:RNA polymerase sigma factor (TIGR02999 family)